MISEFYQCDKDGIPTAWVKRMRESMARLTPRFSASRTVLENIPSDITGRLWQPILSARPIKAPWVSKWSIGDTGWTSAVRRGDG